MIRRVLLALALLLAALPATAQISQPVPIPIPPSIGGTGNRGVTAGALLLGNGNAAMIPMPPRANGDCVVGTNGAWASVPCPGGASSGVSSFNARTGAVTLTSGDVTTAGGLLTANNLSDVASAATARTNLGLGTAATKPSTDFLQAANSLSDVANVSAARTNLGLGTAAIKAASGTGTTVSSVIGTFVLNDCLKAGDAAGSIIDAGLPCVTGSVVSSFNSRNGIVTLTSGDVTAVGAILATNNLSDLTNAVTARTNLGLGSAATKTASGSGGTVASLTGTFTIGHAAVFADVNGTIQDGGAGGGGGGGVASFNTRTGAVTMIASDVSGVGGLLASNNLSDIANPASSRTNLGLGTAAVQNIGAFAQTANNLSDLASASAARSNLGLGTASTAAASTFLAVANNLSDLASAATARTNLGLAAIAASGSATDLIAGTIAATRLPFPTLTTIGAVKAVDCSATSQVIQKINTDGTETCVTPPGSIPSGNAGQIAAWATTGTAIAPFTLGSNFAIDTTGRTVNFTAPIAQRATSCTIAADNTGCMAATGGDMGGTTVFTATATVTIGAISATVFANGQQWCYAVSAGTLTITATPTVLGLPSTSIGATGGGCLQSNGSNLTWIPGRAGNELLASNNLSDLGSAATARTNLGLGTAAVKAASGAGGTVSSVTGTFTIGHLATFADTSGTIQDGGAVGTAVTSFNTRTGAVTLLAADVTAVGFGQLAANNTYTAGQAVTPATLTDAATIAVNAASSNEFTVTLGGNRTLANPTGAIAGQTLIFFPQQDATGGRTLAYGSAYKFPGGVQPTLSTAPNAQDVITCAVKTSAFMTCNAALNYQ